MSVLHIPHRRGVAVRLAVVALAALASSAVGLPTAAAAPSVVIPLSPPDVLVGLYAVENTGPATADPDAEPRDDHVPVEWTGGLEIQIPAPLDGSAMQVSLELSESDEDPTTKTLSTADLALTDLGGGRFSVTFPAEELPHGPVGWLMFENITSTVPGIESMGAVDYHLDFTGTGPSVATVAPQIAVLGVVQCPVFSGTRCPAIPVDAGAAFGITIPPASLLHALGLGSLDDVGLALQRLDPDGQSNGSDPIVLSDVPGLVTVTDPNNAIVTVPADTPGGAYGLTLVHTTGTAGRISITFGELVVSGTYASPRIINAGLHSNTGWGERPEAAAGGRSPLVGAGAGMLLLAGGIAATLFRRSRGTAESCGG